MTVNDQTNGHITQYPKLLLHTDGGCEPKNPGGVAVSAWALFEENGTLLAEEGRVVQDGGPKATNNFAEYCALGLALRWLLDQNWKGSLYIKSDSQLMVKQVLDEWKCKSEHLKKLRDRIWELINELNLHDYTLEWVRREENTYADALCEQTYLAYRQSH